LAFLDIQFLHWRKEVNKDTLKSDLLAGLTGMVVLLPQGVVFAMIAGLPPIYGLYSAMVIPVVAALFQSSNHLISGPTTAMSLVVFSTISAFAEPTTSEFIMLAIGLTLLAGIIQLVLGLAKMGSLINFVSHSVIVGFTAGAAILIATSQIKLILGVSMPRGLEFYDSWLYIFGHLPEINYTVFLVGTSTLLAAIVLKAISKNIPYLLLAMIGGSVLNYFIGGQEVGVEMVRELPRGLPAFSIPALSLHEVQMIMPGAFAIALLGLIEAVAIARAIGMQSGQRINGNQEFISQGISNITGSFFSSYMGSGSFTRSGVNYQAGGKTPLAAIFAAVLLVLVLIFVAPMAGYLPIPALGGIILLVAYNMIDFVHVRSIIKSSKRETIVMGITFLATLLFHLEFAIYFGVFFSLIFFLQETSRPVVRSIATDPEQSEQKFYDAGLTGITQCPQLKILQIVCWIVPVQSGWQMRRRT
jgi:SulP family sulfate permease